MLLFGAMTSQVAKTKSRTKESDLGHPWIYEEGLSRPLIHPAEVPKALVKLGLGRKELQTSHGDNLLQDRALKGSRQSRQGLHALCLLFISLLMEVVC